MTKRLHTSIPVELYLFLKKEAQENHTSMSALLKSWTLEKKRAKEKFAHADTGKG